MLVPYLPILSNDVYCCFCMLISAVVAGGMRALFCSTLASFRNSLTALLWTEKWISTSKHALPSLCLKKQSLHTVTVRMWQRMLILSHASNVHSWRLWSTEMTCLVKWLDLWFFAANESGRQRPQQNKRAATRTWNRKPFAVVLHTSDTVRPTTAVQNRRLWNFTVLIGCGQF